MKSLPLMILMFLSATCIADMNDLDNDTLGDVVGENGVALSLDMKINVDKVSNAPLCPVNGAAGSTIPCRLGIQFSGWESLPVSGGTRGAWLVLKNFYGRIYIPRLTLDAGQVTYTTDAGTSKTIPAFAMSTTQSSGVPAGIIVENLTIQNISIETDSATKTASYTPTPSQLGYQNPDEGGFMALRINDGAGITMRGSAVVFPCLANHPSC